MHSSISRIHVFLISNNIIHGTWTINLTLNGLQHTKRKYTKRRWLKGVHYWIHTHFFESWQFTKSGGYGLFELDLIVTQGSQRLNFDLAFSSWSRLKLKIIIKAFEHHTLQKKYLTKVLTIISSSTLTLYWPLWQWMNDLRN